MFGALFIKECKQIIKSLVYYIYIVVMVLFLTSQMSDSDWESNFTKPEPGQDYYGSMESHDEKPVMMNTLNKLMDEHSYGTYSTYPFGFYKGVILSEQDNNEIEEIIEDLTGKKIEQLELDKTSYYEKLEEGIIGAYESYIMPLADDITYDKFEKEMKRVSRIVGKDSAYEGNLLKKGTDVPMSYEDAVNEYQALCDLDKGTGAYMRLFCDYAGIILLIMPIFLGATRVLRDKRAQAKQVIYAKNISSAKLVATRYLANVLMTFIPVLIIALLIQSPYAYQLEAIGIKPDYLAFAKYPVIWLLPQIMVILALSFLLMELLENVLAVILQIFIAFAALFSADTLTGNFGLKLAARWNTVGSTLNFWDQKQDLYFNRGFYAVVALILIVLTVFIYEHKRKKG